MKLLIVFVTVAFTCVLCAKDPTTVCLPDEFQTDLYSIINGVYGYLALDFKQAVMGIHYVVAGYRVVFNTTDINGSCKRISAGIDINNVETKCLPANAILLTNESRVGVPPNSIDVEGWEFVIGTGVTVISLTATNPAVPVLREYRISGSTVDVVFYGNPQTTITHPDIFTVPAVCPRSTVVG